MSEKHYDVVIIGAGAAGLMCGITAAQRGRKVLIVDHSNKVGKKILMSGGGRCNFTNLDIQPENYLSQNPHFCKSALACYTQWDFIALVDKHGIAYHEKTLGQLFCDDSSKDILNMLLKECDDSGVKIEINQTVSSIEPTDSGYKLSTSTQKLNCKSLVIASGGLSIPKMGASGFGYKVAEQFELKLEATRAGLVPFTFSGQQQDDFAAMSGVALPQVSLSNHVQSFTEDILLTHRGMSGPAALQLSSYWQTGENYAVDLIPSENMTAWLQEQIVERPNIELKTALQSLFPKRFAEYLSVVLFTNKPLKQLTAPELQNIADTIHAWQLKPSGTEGYRTAEVTLGGLSTDELSSKTMECKNQSGLYFIGEVVDVTGHLGGYNFQWAWSSGYAAGCYV